MIKPHRAVAPVAFAALFLAPEASARGPQDPVDGYAGLRLSSVSWSFGSGSFGSGQGDEDLDEFGYASMSAAGAPMSAPFARPLAANEWRVTIPAMWHWYDGLRDGRTNLTNAQVFALPQGYTELGDELNVGTYAIDLAYGWNDNWTFSAALPFHDKRMDNVTNTGQTFETKSSGVGDLVLGAIRSFPQGNGRTLLINLGLGCPTGSFTETDEDETGTAKLLPYVMQLGTGSWQLFPGVTWLADEGTWSWGASGQWRLHLDENSSDYTVGDTTRVSGWMSRQVAGNLSGYSGLQGYFCGDYSGQDPGLDPFENPLNDPDRQGGNRGDLLGGLRYDLGPGDELELEVGVPIDEWVDGPQLSTTWFLGLALRLGW